MQVIAAALLEDDAGLGDATSLATCAPLLVSVVAVPQHTPYTVRMPLCPSPHACWGHQTSMAMHGAVSYTHLTLPTILLV